MNANAEKWVAALESGEYKQGVGALRNSDDEFCCFGVACDLAVKAGVIPPPTLRHIQYRYEGNAGVLRDGTRTWLGLVSDWGDYDGGCLTFLNDKGASFAEIAQTIRTHPELFVDGES